jgi:hypothetical protein
MPKEYAGRMFYEITGPDYDITQAHVTKGKLSIDWVEEGVKGGIVASSEEGIIYTGTYRYSDRTQPGKVTLRLYRAKDDWVFLFGSWVEDGTNGLHKGHWAFQMQPN